MLELLLETATDVCSVGLARDGELIAERTATEVHQHASHLTVFIREVLSKAGVGFGDLEAIRLSDGPGSYTSLRVGAATAKGLCTALPKLQLRTVPTLDALARAVQLPADATGFLLSTIPSRRGEVFGRVYRAADRSPVGETLNVRLTEEGWWVQTFGENVESKEVFVTGPGQTRVEEHLTPDQQREVRLVAPTACHATHLLAPAAAPVESVAEYEPTYLNAPFVTTPRKRSLL